MLAEVDLTRFAQFYMLVVMHIAPGTTPYTFLVPYGVSHLGIKSPAAAADLLVQKSADTQPPFSYLTVMAEGTVHVLTQCHANGELGWDCKRVVSSPAQIYLWAGSS